MVSDGLVLLQSPDNLSGAPIDVSESKEGANIHEKANFIEKLKRKGVKHSKAQGRGLREGSRHRSSDRVVLARIKADDSEIEVSAMISRDADDINLFFAFDKIFRLRANRVSHRGNSMTVVD